MDVVVPSKVLGKYSWGGVPFLPDDKDFQWSDGGYPLSKSSSSVTLEIPSFTSWTTATFGIAILLFYFNKSMVSAPVSIMVYYRCQTWKTGSDKLKSISVNSKDIIDSSKLKSDHTTQFSGLNLYP